MKLWYGLILLGLLIHLRVALTQPLFGDETNTILMARDSSYLQLFTHQLEKIHPNGSYLMTKVGWDLGLGVTGIRIFHWILFCLTLWPVYHIFRLLQLSKNQALIGLAVWTWSPYILLQSYLIRMYAYGIFFLTLSLYFTLNKRWRLSVLTDLLGISFVSGYWMYIVAKYMALGKKIKLKYVGIMAAAMGINIFTAMNVERAITTHLDWMPAVQAPDLLSMFTALLGLTSTGYYEGYSSTPSSLALTGGLSLLIAALVVVFIRSKFTSTNTENYFLHLTFFMFLGYLAIWLLALIFKLPVFHIRQMFPVAVLLLLLLTYVSFKNSQSNKLFVTLLVLPLLLLAGKRTVNYAMGQIYPDHMIIKLSYE